MHIGNLIVTRIPGIKYIIFSNLFILITTSSCNGPGKHKVTKTIHVENMSFIPDSSINDNISRFELKELKYLNERAVYLSTRFNDNKDSLDKSIVYLDKALKIDSSYLITYMNKMVILAQAGQRRRTISTANMMSKTNPNNILVEMNANLIKGNEYTRMGIIDSANHFYGNARRYLEKMLKHRDNLNYKVMIVTIMLLQDQKEAATEYINELRPDEKEDIIDYIKNFDKEQYLSNY